MVRLRFHCRAAAQHPVQVPLAFVPRPASYVRVAVILAGAVASCLLPASSRAFAAVAVDSVYSDHMVLQMERPVPLRGTASPGENMTVELESPGYKKWSASTQAEPGGQWKVDLPARRAGGPHTITVTGTNKVQLKDVLFGEVWLCSGQSNMARVVEGAKDGAAEARAANFPQIRFFSNASAARKIPSREVVVGRWKVCTPETAARFSAVGYYFGRQVHRDRKVPVGLIQASLGGTAIEPWLNLESLTNSEGLKDLLARYEKGSAAFPEPLDDSGWEKPDLSEADWNEITMPGAWEESGVAALKGLDGVVWFRTTVEIPPSWAGKELTLNLPPIDDGDTTYFNGHKVGGLDLETPMVWTLPRVYTVPGAQVKAGKAVLAIRVSDQLGGGGLVGPATQLGLAPADGSAEKLPLAGTWKYRIAQKWPGSGLPTSLYNGMVAPWTGYPLQGVTWYQGESNAGNARAYQRTLPGLINGWRAAWGQPDMPFLIVQLPNYRPLAEQPVESQWAELREAQALTAASLPNVRLAVTLGLGEAGDIHPMNKQDVGARLAALSRFDQPAPLVGPVWKGMRREGDAYVFSLTGGKTPYAWSGDAGKAFAVAGADEKFVWAQAELKKGEVWVSSPQVPAPAYLRYAWADNPPGYLTGADGYPAPPMRVNGDAMVPPLP